MAPDISSLSSTPISPSSHSPSLPHFGIWGEKKWRFTSLSDEQEEPYATCEVDHEGDGIAGVH